MNGTVEFISQIIGLHLDHYSQTHPGESISGGKEAIHQAAEEIYTRLLEENSEPRPISVQDIQTQLTQIQNAAEENDHEKAHILEDRLFYDVLRTIALDDPEDPQVLAESAIESRDILFGRFCA